MLAEIATGITLFKAGRSLYKYITGTTLSNDLEQVSARIEAKLEEIEHGIYHVPIQEVIDTKEREQKCLTDMEYLRVAARPLREMTSSNVIVSNSIITPGRFQERLARNPDEILHDIHPLSPSTLPHIGDPTLVPVIFEKWGQYFVGFAKIGYARDYLDLQYIPYILHGHEPPTSNAYTLSRQGPGEESIPNSTQAGDGLRVVADRQRLKPHPTPKTRQIDQPLWYIDEQGQTIVRVTRVPSSTDTIEAPDNEKGRTREHHHEI